MSGPLSLKVLFNRNRLVFKNFKYGFQTIDVRRRFCHADTPHETPHWKQSEPVQPQPWLYPLKLDESRDSLMRFIGEYDTFLFDCDGVLWGNDHHTKFGNVKKCLEGLQSLNKRLIFVTNNSMHNRSAFREIFMEKCDFEVAIEDVFNVNYAAAVYLKSIANIDGMIYAIGSRGLSDELNSLGLENTGYGTDHDLITDKTEALLRQRMHPQVKAVLVGFDIHMGYNKIYKAASYLSDPKCVYVATNDIETRVQIGPGRIQPLTGVLTAAVNAASNRRPIVIGKPYPHLMTCIMHSYPNIDLKRTIMIGDSIKTDICFAANIGIDSVLVLSGSSRQEDLAKTHDNREFEMPTYILSSVERISEIM